MIPMVFRQNRQNPNHKTQNPKPRKWLAPLLSFALCLTTAGALTYRSFTGDSSAYTCYKEKKCKIDSLSHEEKLRVWRIRINQGGCDLKVIEEANEEYRRLLKLGHLVQAENLMKEIDDYKGILYKRTQEWKCKKR